ncbi:hypothetical protein PVAND_015445 [Polypedilum vanderplanki]|uniref:Uncharacterized protein n=1 Tax=Polypedilum vanderplanki TaxID=319348 RepID=A0A9J6BC70_POLVA|nr:hypothetical protein PVAND_015445 [Polypedilum vanderplanki]
MLLILPITFPITIFGIRGISLDFYTCTDASNDLYVNEVNNSIDVYWNMILLPSLLIGIIYVFIYIGAKFYLKNINLKLNGNVFGNRKKLWYSLAGAFLINLIINTIENFIENSISFSVAFYYKIIFSFSIILIVESFVYNERNNESENSPSNFSFRSKHQIGIDNVTVEDNQKY